MNTTMSPVDNNSADLWSGPCTCAQIAEGWSPVGTKSEFSSNSCVFCNNQKHPKQNLKEW